MPRGILICLNERIAERHDPQERLLRSAVRYWQVILGSCLKLFPNGELAEVGERGISLSGGQKQHINVCRAIYCGADVQIFDVRIPQLPQMSD